jgi:hypothetical protein
VGLAVVPAIVVLCVWLWGPRGGAKYLVLFGLGVSLMLVPWTLRNALTHGEAAPVHPGRFLIEPTVKHNPTGISMYAEREGRNDPPEMRAARRLILDMESGKPDSAEIFNTLSRRLNLTESETSELMWRLALTAIRRHPDIYIQGTIIQFGQILQGQMESVESHVAIRRQSWKGRDLSALLRSQSLSDLLEDPAADDPSHTRTADMVTQVYQPTLWMPLLLILAAVAAAESIRRADRRIAAAPMLIVGSLLVVSAVVVGYVPRYRYPLDPLFQVSAAVGIVWLMSPIGVLLKRHESRWTVTHST